MGIKTGAPGYSNQFERVIVYSEPKSGKTRFSTSLPERFGKIVYFAADPGSESLGPVLPQYRERIYVIQSGPEVGKVYNPRADAMFVAQHDWTKDPKTPGAGTLVWDTLTQTSIQILAHIADSGEFSQSKHISIGTPGQPDFYNIPMEGDYGAAQNSISRTVDFLFRLPMHVIVVCHATYDEPKGGGSLEGGPATVGKATVRSFPGRFNTAIHLVRRDVPGKVGEPSVSEITAWTERHGIWSAGIRSSHEVNPIPKIRLNPDPINFWDQYDGVFWGGVDGSRSSGRAGESASVSANSLR